MSLVRPHISLMQKNFIYRNSANTDVTLTWRKHGWKPQAELKKVQNDKK